MYQKGHGRMYTKKSVMSQEHGPKLTRTEREVLDLITKEFLTYKQIAIRRGVSRAAVSNVVINLKKKGVLNIGFQEVYKTRPTSTDLHKIRLHGQEFNIKILWKDYKYMKVLARTNLIEVDGNTVRLYKNSIEVYSGQSFQGDDIQKATANSFEYWNRFFIRLEHEINIIIKKPRAQNIKIVNSHYAETNNEYARDLDNKGEGYIKVYTRDDGKLWFLIDNSFNLHEAETVHPGTSKPDMGRVKDFFNEIRDGAPTMTELMTVMKTQAKINQETAAGLNTVVNFVKSQLPQEPGELKKGPRPDYFG